MIRVVSKRDMELYCQKLMKKFEYRIIDLENQITKILIKLNDLENIKWQKIQKELKQ